MSTLLTLFTLFSHTNFGSDACNRILISRTNVVSDELIPVRDRLDGGGVLVEDIDLFEGETLCLWNAEVGEDEATDASGSPNEEHFWSEVSVFWVDNVRCSVTDTEIPEPVGGGGHGHGLCTNREGEDFGSDDPSDRTPSRSEKGNVNANKGDEDFLTGLVCDGDGDTDDGDQVLAYQHTSGTDEEKTTTSDVVYSPECGDGHDDVDDVGDDGDDEGVGETGIGEEGGTIVEDEVDTGELLPTLEEDTGEGTEEDLVGTHLEAIGIGALTYFFLETQVGFNVLEFGLYVGVFDGDAEETMEGDGGLFITMSLDEITR